MAATNQPATRWQKFASLEWYDSAIEFTFKVVAKTSEPLLAAGLVVSAADLLTKGALMRDNPGLTFAWAWAQSIAIEASSGVVFVYALQSFKGQDKLKGWLYLVLSILLAITGGAMLLLQLVANITGAGENTLPATIVYGLAVLRVVVSISYVYLCRAKHIRFTDLVEEAQSSPAAPASNTSSISDETVQLILSKLAKLDALEQRLAQPVMVSEAALLQLQAPASVEQPGKVDQGFGQNGTNEPDKPEVGFGDMIEALLATEPGLDEKAVAGRVGCSITTAKKWMKRLEVPGA